MWGTGIFKMSHTDDYVKDDRKPTKSKYRMSPADRKVWNFWNKAFLKNIVMLCLLKLHRIVILFSSPASVLLLSASTSKTKCTPPPRYNVWPQHSMEVGGGGGKRVNQTSASSVVRLYVAKLQLNERALRGILTPSSFKSFRRGLRQDLRAPGSELRLQIEHCLAQQRTEKAVVYRKNLVSMIQCSKIEGLH